MPSLDQFRRSLKIFSPLFLAPCGFSPDIEIDKIADGAID
jgi:hypothetical protein